MTFHTDGLSARAILGSLYQPTGGPTSSGHSLESRNFDKGASLRPRRRRPVIPTVTPSRGSNCRQGYFEFRESRSGWQKTAVRR